MLIARIATAIVAIPIILGLIYLGGLPFDFAVVVVALVAAGESASLLKLENVHWTALASGSAALVAGLASLGTGGLLLGLAGLIGLSLVAVLVAFPPEPGPEVAGRWAGLIASAGYVGLPLGLLILIHSWPGASVRLLTTVAGSGVVVSWGAAWVLFLFTSVWSVDTVAYAVGRAFGRRPLAPRISPRKTWEGTVAAVLASMLVGAVWAPSLHLTPLAGVLYGATIGIAAVVGDLTESGLKRSAQVKDAGSLIPGHGGVLDRIDGLIFSTIVVFLIGTISGVTSGTPTIA